MPKKIDNNTIILDSVISQRKENSAREMADNDFFEMFSFEQTLKGFDLSYDELLSGKTGKGDDGGIDGFFFFINSNIVLEEIGAEEYKRSPILDLFLIQSKRTNTFSEHVFDKVITTTKDIFNLNKSVQELEKFYNSNIIEKTNIFRKSYLALASKHPRLKLHFFYTSRGNTAKINRKIKNKIDILNSSLESLFPGSSIEIEFFGARELLDLSRLEKKYTLSLDFVENYLSKGKDNYVILSNIADYYKFSIDEKGTLRRYIFNANVRDFQGYIEVNKDIEKTLKEGGDLDFWWLNNGITILASKASIIGKTITLDDVQIINGLQTTTCIYNYFKLKKDSIGEEDKKKSILIKIIISNDAIARDKIIKATNFQTSIPPASLKASDRIQHDIEDFFKKNDCYYDRRKNFYKNMGKPHNKIVSIPFLAQSIMAIILREPDNARARPSSLIKKDDDYLRVFNKDINPKIFLFCAQVVKKIESFSRKELKDFTYQEKSNLKFHIAMVTIINLTKEKNYNIEILQELALNQVDDRLMGKSFSDTISLARQFMKTKKWSLDRIAKSRDFINYIEKKIEVK